MSEPKKVTFWSKDEDQVLIDNRNNTLIDGLVTLLQAKGFTRTSDAVEKRCRRLNLIYDGPAKLVEADIEDKDIDWKKIIKLSLEFQSKPIDTTTGFAKQHRRIVSLSDIHFPFQRQAVLEQAVETAKGADILVLNGDIFDGYSISSFKKNKHIPILREYSIVLEFVKGLVPLFSKIYLVRGNHEKRFSGSFSKLTGEDEPPYGKDLLSRVAAGEVYDDDGNLTGNYEWDNVFYDEAMPWFVLIGKTLFVHPKAFSSVPGGTVAAVYKFFKEKGNYEFDSIVVGHCFDDQTEILTNNGFKTVETIKTTDKAMTLDLTTGKSEFNSIDGVHSYDNYKELIEFTGEHGLSVVVTDKHGMISKEANEFKLNTAEELFNKNFKIPCVSEWKSEVDYEITNDKLSLLAWIVTEGNIQYSGKKNPKPYIRIAQSDSSKDSYVNEISDLLKRLGYKFTLTKRYNANTTIHNQHRNFDAYRWSIGVQHVGWIFDYLNPDKTFKQDLINGLSFSQSQFLLDELCKGDGSKCSTEHWRAYYSNNKNLIDQVQILAFKAGKRTKLSIREDVTEKTMILHLSDTDTRIINESKRIPYDGKVWCLSVPNKTLVARRNGFVFITQNTHQQALYRYKGTLLIEQGCLTAVQEYSFDDGLMFSGNQINGFVELWQDEQGNTDFESVKLHYYGTQFPPEKEI